jgi:hypothetical protein
MIDPWRQLPDWNKPLNVDNTTFDAVYREAMAAIAFARDRVTVLRGTTIEMIHRIADGSLDFAYIDGDHTLRGIAIDLMNAWPKLRTGGFLAGDDLSASIWQHAEAYEPTMVFPMAVYFAEAMRARIFALPYQQFLIEKPATADGHHELIDLAGHYGDTSLRRQMQHSPRQKLRALVPEPIKKVVRALRG